MRVRDDAGVATVLGIGLVAVLLLAGAGGAAVAVGARIHQRAAVAADAAAVAAAVAATATGTPCDRAAAFARLNDATLVSCDTEGADVWVVAEATPPRWLAWAGVARVKARAGPADAPVDGTNQDEAGRASPPS